MKKELINQIGKFFVVGIIATVIDYVILIICKELIGLPILLSTSIAFVISLIFNYILSTKWVFKVSSSRKKSILFILFSIIGLLLTEFIMWLLNIKLLINYLIVKVIATAIVMVFNFITRKFILEKI